MRTGRSPAFRPCGRASDCRSGLDESFLITLDFTLKPFGAGLCADHGENRRRLYRLPFTRAGVLQFHFLECEFPDIRRISVRKRISMFLHASTRVER